VEDYFRVFFVLWAGHWPLSATHLLGFWLFTASAALLLCGLITVSCVDLFQRRQFTPLAIGCAVFAYFLLSWERHLYVQHYGVPIIGHFVERPEYDAHYYVEVERDGSDRKYRVLADIHVEGRSETEEVGEDNFGRGIYATTAYRDVWLRCLHFPNGESVAIHDQMEPLHLGDSVFATDARGRTWYVKLLNEYVH